MTIGKSLLAGSRAKAAAAAEQVLMEQLAIEPKKLQRIAKLMEPKNLKRIGIAALGAGALLSALGTAGHDRLYRAAVSREIRKQLEPVNKKLDELQAQNEQLIQQNEQLRRELEKA